MSMDFQTANRGAFALLLTVGTLSVCWGAGAVVVPYAVPAKPGVEIPASPAEAPPAPPVASAVAPTAPVSGAETGTGAGAGTGGDVAHGAALAQQSCAMCHTLTADAPDTVGPNLFHVSGRKVGGKEGYSYSQALSGHGGQWDDATLNAWLTNPAAFAPGTRMSFPGIADDKDRADVVAWLKTLR
ncbi:c-type cytochrome [Acetobacter fallax]|nr:cytochrome c family protein [Acetobacter fallax]